MDSSSRRLRRIIVIDAESADYQPLVAWTSVTFFTTGDEALRACRRLSPRLWMINVRLADTSGLALLKLIRARQRRAIIYVIGDDYSLEDELAARAGGATAYMCKPVSAAWLAGHVHRCRSRTIRAGPEPFP